MWYYCRPFSHTCLPICLPAMALHPGACFRNFPNWFRALGHVRDNNGCLVVHQHPCSQLFKCQNGGKAPKSHPRGGNWVLAALVTVVVSFAGVSCVGAVLVGDAHSKHKCWVFCAMSRRTFVSLHYFPLCLCSGQVSQQSGGTSAFLMAGECQRPWQVSVCIKQTLLHHREVMITVDFLTRDCVGAWSCVGRGCRSPAGRRSMGCSRGVELQQPPCWALSSIEGHAFLGVE